MSQLKDNVSITFLNPYSYLMARKNKELFKSFELKIDGILLVKILHFAGFKTIKRESFDMTSLAPEVFKESIEKNKTIYFIGTKKGTIDKAIKNIKNQFSDLNISGYRDGYFNNDTERNIVLDEIKKIDPDIVICGMGTPLQEKFLVDLRHIGWKGTGYTCGGFLHQTATAIEYYPKWIDRYNLRWLYRIYDEPKLFKRYFVEYPKFLYFFIYDALKNKNFIIEYFSKKTRGEIK